MRSTGLERFGGIALGFVLQVPMVTPFFGWRSKKIMRIPAV